ncbi:MAG TPA: ABC transporter permease [Gammaproteobacteria bacterium]
MSADTTISFRSAFGWTGRRAIRLFTYPVDLFLFIFHALRDWAGSGRVHHTNDHAALRQVLRAGADPLPAILLLGFVVGFTFALPLIMFSPQLAETELAPLLMQLIGLELGSLLTAVVLIGRTGRAMAVELANMKLHGEVRGLERLGIDMNHFFVAPRLIATGTAQLVLATYFTAAALFCGMLLASLLYRGEASGLAVEILAAVETDELLIFIAKNLLFGLVIAGAACYSALQVEIAPTEVPERARQAATNSLLLIFFINGTLALLAT